MGYGSNWGMMGGFGGGFGGLGMFFWLILLVVIVAAVVWFMRSNVRPPSDTPQIRRSSALDVLEERYARGEIQREEYLEKRKDLLG